jgi:hypothetical protein
MLPSAPENGTANFLATLLCKLYWEYMRGAILECEQYSSAPYHI